MNEKFIQQNLFRENGKKNDAHRIFGRFSKFFQTASIFVFIAEVQSIKKKKKNQLNIFTYV